MVQMEQPIPSTMLNITWDAKTMAIRGGVAMTDCSAIAQKQTGTTPTRHCRISAQARTLRETFISTTRAGDLMVSAVMLMLMMMMSEHVRTKTRVYADSGGDLQNCSDAAMKGFCNNSFAQDHATKHNLQIPNDWLVNTCPITCGLCNNCSSTETMMCSSAQHDNTTIIHVECVGTNEKHFSLSTNATRATCANAIGTGGTVETFRKYSCADGFYFFSGIGGQKGQEFFCPGAVDREKWILWMQLCGCAG